MKAIAIGALGGSGTRAVAKIMIEAGVFMGDELNESLDNLLFTRLFKNPEWHQQVKERGVYRRYQVFQKIMKRQRLNACELLVLRNALKTNLTYPSSKEHLKVYMINELIKKNGEEQQWGWKEPNTHIFIDHFLDQSTNLKYIHILRHGMDMAFSANKKQLFNWGYVFGISANERMSESELARLQLDFWIASTRRMLIIQKKHPESVRVIRLADLIQSPQKIIGDMLRFAEIKVDDEKLRGLSSIPQATTSTYRYRTNDLSIFSKDQIAFVEEMGFAV